MKIPDLSGRKYISLTRKQEAIFTDVDVNNLPFKYSSTRYIDPKASTLKNSVSAHQQKRSSICIKIPSVLLNMRHILDCRTVRCITLSGAHFHQPRSHRDDTAYRRILSRLSLVAVAMQDILFPCLPLSSLYYT